MNDENVKTDEAEKIQPTDYQGTAKDRITDNAQTMFDNFVHTNFTAEQKEEINK